MNSLATVLVALALAEENVSLPRQPTRALATSPVTSKEVEVERKLKGIGEGKGKGIELKEGTWKIFAFVAMGMVFGTFGGIMASKFQTSVWPMVVMGIARIVGLVAGRRGGRAVELVVEWYSVICMTAAGLIGLIVFVVFKADFKAGLIGLIGLIVFNGLIVVTFLNIMLVNFAGAVVDARNGVVAWQSFQAVTGVATGIVLFWTRTENVADEDEAAGKTAAKVGDKDDENEDDEVDEDDEDDEDDDP